MKNFSPSTETSKQNRGRPTSEISDNTAQRDKTKDKKVSKFIHPKVQKAPRTGLGLAKYVRHMDVAGITIRLNGQPCLFSYLVPNWIQRHPQGQPGTHPGTSMLGGRESEIAILQNGTRNFFTFLLAVFGYWDGILAVWEPEWVTTESGKVVAS